MTIHILIHARMTVPHDLCNIRVLTADYSVVLPLLPLLPLLPYSPKSLRLECRRIPPPLGGTTGDEGSSDPSLLLRLAATLLARLREPSTDGCRLGVMLRGGVCRTGDTGDTVMISSVIDELLSVRDKGGSSGSGVAYREEPARDGCRRGVNGLVAGKLSIPSPLFNEDRRRKDSRLLGAITGTEGEEASLAMGGCSCRTWVGLVGPIGFTVMTSGGNESIEVEDSDWCIFGDPVKPGEPLEGTRGEGRCWWLV